MRVPWIMALLVVGVIGGAYFQHLLTTLPISLLLAEARQTMLQARASEVQGATPDAPASNAGSGSSIARVFSSPRQLTARTAVTSPQPEPTLASGPVARTARAVLSEMPTAKEARKPLVLEIQRELRRLACYKGALDGVWGGDTVAAARIALSKVDANVPSIEPDFIILGLVQGQPAGTCAVSCADDHVLKGQGRCEPREIIATAPRLSAPASTIVAPAPTSAAVAADIHDTTTRTIIVPFPTLAESPKGSARTILAPSSRMAIGAPNDVKDATARTQANLGVGTVGVAVGPSPAPKKMRRASAPAPRRKPSLNDPGAARRLFFGPSGG